MHFKYSLDTTSKKNICPKCNKKTFVLYVDNETGKYLSGNFGRCDREQNCGFHNSPPLGKKAYLIDFLLFKSISNKAFKFTDLNGIISIIPKSQVFEVLENKCFVSEWYLKSSNISYLNNDFKYFNNSPNEVINIALKTPQNKIKEKPTFHDLSLLNDYYFENAQNDNLTEFLKTKFNKDEVFKVMQNYFITGTNLCWNNATIFWQIDNKEQIHAGKIMLYDMNTGKRKKEPYNHINWVHKALKVDNFNLNQCLFGLHLINEDYQKSIAIVESEKTAIIMSIFIPSFIWLATGSKGNFKHELLKPLKKRNIIAFPDKGEYNNWLNTSTELNALGFKIVVSDLIENTDFESGFDLADYYFYSN